MTLRIVPGMNYKNTMKPETTVSNVNIQEQNLKFSTETKSKTEGQWNDSTNQQAKGQNNTNQEKQIESAIDKANQMLKFTRTRCEFTYHEDINRVAIKVIDRDTEEIIREIPPEETLELVQKLWEFAGLIIDEKI